MGLGHTEVQPTRLNGIRLSEAVLGTTLPIVIGQHRVGWKLGWYGDFQSKKVKQQGGKGLGKSGSTFVYSASVLGLVCQGPCSNFLGVWGLGGTGKYELDTYSETFTIPASPANPTYTPTHTADFALDHGVGASEAYSVTVNDFGSQGTVTYTGSQLRPIIPITPGNPTPPPGGYSPPSGAGKPYTFNSGDAGKTVTITYTAYRYQIVSSELASVPLAPPYTVTVQYQSVFKSDAGVAFYPSGVALTVVGGTPSVSGTYNPNGGNYKFAPADAGKGIEISYVYTDTNTDTNAPNTLGLTFQGGGLGQAPWAYLTTNHPGFALGYSEVAYVATAGMYLGYSNVLPQLNFEIAGVYQGPGGVKAGNGIKDANVAIAAYNLLANPTYKLNFPLANLDESLLGTFQITGSVTSGTFQAFEEVHQTSTGAIVTINSTPPTGSNPMIVIGVLTGVPDASHTWTGVQSGAVYTPSAAPAFTTAAGGSTGAQTSAQAYWAANSFFISSVLDQQSSLMAVFGDWFEAGNIFCSWDEGLFKFIPLGQQTAVGNGFTYQPPTGSKSNITHPVVDLDDNDFVTSKDKDPITIDQAPWQSRWNRTGVRWSVRENDYNEDTFQVEDAASINSYGLMTESAKDFQFLTTYLAAQFSGTLRLQRFQSIFTTFKFTLKDNFCWLSPGDIVTVTDGLLGQTTSNGAYMFGRTPIRIIKMVDSFPEKKGIEIEAESFPWSVGTALIGNPQATVPSNTNSGQQQDPGNTQPIIIEIPNRGSLYAGDTIYIYVSGTESNWGGCQIFVSDDGKTYTFYEQLDTPAKLGTLDAAFPYSAANPDNINVLTVDMALSGAQLQSVSEASFENNSTMSALLSPGGTFSPLNTAQNGANLGTSTQGSGGTQGPLPVTAAAQSANYLYTPQWTNPTGVVGSSTFATTTVGLSNAALSSPANTAATISAPSPWQNASAITSTSSSSMCGILGPVSTSLTPDVTTTNYTVQAQSGATITGVVITVTGVSANECNHNYPTAQLVYNGSTIGSAKTSSSYATPSPGVNFTFGTSGDLWGATLTPAIVNSTSFGVKLHYNGFPCGALFGFVGFYNLKMTVYFTGGFQPLEFSYWINCTNPKFTMPQSGVGNVAGVQVTLNSYVTSYSPHGFLPGNPEPGLVAQLIVNGAPAGAQKIVWTSPGFPTVNTPYTLGSSTDTWGVSGLTAAQVNASNFGVAFFATDGGDINLNPLVTEALNNVKMTISWAGGSSGAAWVNPSNVKSTSAYATATIPTGATQTLPLVATNFNYTTLPFGFEPQGVEVQCEALSTSGSSAVLYAQLFYNGLRIGNLKKLTLSGSNANYVFGSSADLWGTNGTQLNLDVINNANFGVVFYVTDATVGHIESLRNVRMRVFGESVYGLELIAYQEANLTGGGNTYALTNITRGLYGSYPVNHQSGTQFLRMDNNGITYKVDPTYRSKSIFFKFLSFNAYGNQLQSLANVPAFEVQILGPTSAPGAIDADTGALVTGTAQNSVGRIDPSINAVQGSFGVDSVPVGYILANTDTANPSGTPTWSPLISAGGGSGALVQQKVLGDAPVVTDNLVLNPWDYGVVDTSVGGNPVFLELPIASGTVNGTVKVGNTSVTVSKKNTSYVPIYVVADPANSDTIGFDSGNTGGFDLLLGSAAFEVLGARADVLTGAQAYKTLGGMVDTLVGLTAGQVLGGVVDQIPGTVSSGTFQAGETITQTTSLATAVFQTIDASGTIYVTSISGSPNNSDIWTGGTSGATYTPTDLPISAIFTVGEFVEQQNTAAQGNFLALDGSGNMYLGSVSGSADTTSLWVGASSGAFFRPTAIPSTGTFDVTETITQVTSSATAVVLGLASSGNLYVNSVGGSSNATDIWIGGTSGAFFVPTAVPTLGVLSSGEPVVQNLTVTSATFLALDGSGNMYTATVTGTADNISLWVGQVSGAAFLPTAVPTTATLVIGETLTQATSTATAVLIAFDGLGNAYVKTVTGVPDATHIWTGGTSGSFYVPTAVPTVNTFVAGETLTQANSFAVAAFVSIIGGNLYVGSVSGSPTTTDLWQGAVSGSVFIPTAVPSSAVFAAGDVLTQATSLATATWASTLASGRLAVTSVSGAPDATHLWTAAPSGALFVPSAVPVTATMSAIYYKNSTVVLTSDGTSNWSPS